MSILNFLQTHRQLTEWDEESVFIGSILSEQGEISANVYGLTFMECLERLQNICLRCKGDLAVQVRIYNEEDEGDLLKTNSENGYTVISVDDLINRPCKILADECREEVSEHLIDNTEKIEYTAELCSSNSSKTYIFTRQGQYCGREIRFYYDFPEELYLDQNNNIREICRLPFDYEKQRWYDHTGQNRMDIVEDLPWEDMQYLSEAHFVDESGNIIETVYVRR